mgnify:FL=1|jgi:hypothetical protein
MCFSVGVRSNALLWFQPSGSGKEIVLRPWPRPLPVHSIRGHALPQMRQNGLNRVRIGDICDHPQGGLRDNSVRLLAAGYMLSNNSFTDISHPGIGMPCRNVRTPVELAKQIQI